jgi:site-specific recombinase XerD
MLHSIIPDFLSYCKTYGFGTRSIEVFSSMLNKFSQYINSLHINSIREISYKHLLSFVTSGNPSVYIKKQRVWTLHHFFHYLKIIKIFKTNIASKLPYPKIKKKEPAFLSVKELKLILNYFISEANSHTGIRNLIIVLFLVFLGLRISAIIKINIQDINLKNSSVLVTEKGNRKRIVLLPQVLCFFLYPYIKNLDREIGPLFLSNRNKKLSHRMAQHFFKEASNTLGMHIYSRIFRHTAATQLNQIAGLEVTKHVLGHRRRESTKRYVHLNPDVYTVFNFVEVQLYLNKVKYMRRHPFMKFNLI